MRGTKRKRGEGVWELRAYVGRDPVTGNPKQVSKTFHGSAREADEALRDLIEQQVPGRSDGAGATLGQLLDAWLSECERMDLSPTTLRVYRTQIEHTIRPALGSIKVQRLGAKDLDDLYRAMKEKGSSPKTVRNHHASSRLRSTRPCGGGGSGGTWPRWPNRHVSRSVSSGRLRSTPCDNSWLPPKSVTRASRRW